MAVPLLLSVCLILIAIDGVLARCTTKYFVFMRRALAQCEVDCLVSCAAFLLDVEPSISCACAAFLIDIQRRGLCSCMVTSDSMEGPRSAFLFLVRNVALLSGYISLRGRSSIGKP